MADITAFRRAWDSGRSPGESKPAAQRRSPHGHINLTGAADEPSAADLVPSDPRFWAEIETGVAPLVLAVVSLGLMTYSSCEGHQVGAAYGEPKLRRTVGLLPRSPDELALVQRVLDTAIAAYGRISPPDAGITLSQVPRTLSDDSGLIAPVVDIYLDPAEGTTVEHYFRHLDTATTLAVGAIVEGRARAMTGGAERLES